MSRHKDPARRDALLAAGQRVLSAHGVENATIDEVTAAAGVAKGTFYLYFHSKNDLVSALRQQFATSLADAVTTAMEHSHSADWPQVAQQLLEVAIDSYVSVAPRYQAVLHHPTDDAGAEWSAEIVAMLSKLLTQGVDAGAARVDDPDLMATLIFHAVHGMCHQALSTPSPPDRRRLANAARQLLDGILVRPGGL